MKVSGVRGVIGLLFLIIIIFSGCASSGQKAAAGSPGKTSPTSKSFPVFALQAPQNEAEKNYLGVSRNFYITQIKSPVIIIGVFSTTCPHCRIFAPDFNKLYEAIQARPDLKDKIKVIGLMDSSASQVDLFRAKYKLSFPLFSGQDSVITNQLGVKYLPKLIGVRNNGDGTMEEFYSKTGESWFWNENKLLKKIITLSKLETGNQ